MTKLKYAKVESRSNLNRYDWDKRNIGEVEKSGSFPATSSASGTADADDVPLASQVDDNVRVLMEDRTGHIRFPLWEDVLDFLVNETMPKTLEDYNG